MNATVIVIVVIVVVIVMVTVIVAVVLIVIVMCSHAPPPPFGLVRKEFLRTSSGPATADLRRCAAAQQRLIFAGVQLEDCR